MKKALFVLLFAVVPHTWSAEKDATTAGYLSILQHLRQLGRENRDSDPKPKLRAAVDALLPRGLSSDQLYRLGISTCLVAYPQEASSDIPFDAVFAYASRHCAILLSERIDTESVYFLRKMQPICGADGGEHLMYSELMAHQEQLRKDAQTK
jgi:hypothetical protein